MWKKFTKNAFFDVAKTSKFTFTCVFVGKHEKGAVDRYTYVASFFKPPKLAKKQLHSCKYQDIVVGIISFVLKTNKNSSLWNKLDVFIQIKALAIAIRTIAIAIAIAIAAKKAIEYCNMQ